MRVIGERVLVEQVAIKKKSTIIGLEKSEVDPDFWIVTNKILAIGTAVENPEIKVGEIPIFGEFTNFGNVKIISKTEEKIVSHIIVHYNDIIGIDDLEETAN